MGWLGRLFDRRDAWVRLVLLDVTGLNYLVFSGDDGRVTTGGQWVLAITAFVTIVALGRWPVVNLVVQAGLLATAFLLVDDSLINQVASSWALGELVVWAARTRTFVLGVALLTGVHVGIDVIAHGAPVTGLILPIGLPLLLGLVVRTLHEVNSQAERRAAASESRAARADERAAIARELHDVVAHHVASMVLRVGVARHVVPGIDPRVAEVLDDVHSTGTAALTDLRRLVAVLRDDGAVHDAAATAIEPGALPAALGAAVDTARRAGLTVEADIDEAVGTIDSVRGLAVLRLTQEALTNVAKHAGPSAHARLRVTVERGDVIWEVSDDGANPPSGGDVLSSAYGSSGGDRGLSGGDRGLSGGDRGLSGGDRGLSGGDRGLSGGGDGLGSGGPGRTRDGGRDLGGDGRGEAHGAGHGPAGVGGSRDELGGGGHGLTGMRERVEVLGGELSAGPTQQGWRVATVLPGGVA